MAKTTNIAGNTFLFTGKLTEFTREDAEAHVEAEGGKVLSGVSAKLNYLVVGEDAGSKLAKAEALGTVTILHEKEFLKMMNSGKPTAKVKTTETLKASDQIKKTKVFVGKKLLDAKAAKKSISDYLDIDGYDSIDPKAAAILAAQDSILSLNGIKFLDVDAAKALAKQEGENDLLLNGLEELDADVAKELAKHNGSLSLNGIHSLSVEAAKALANCKFDISLDCIQELDDASSFIGHSALLSLGGLKTMSDKVADQLCKKNGGVNLVYDYSESMKSISPSIAKLIVKCNSGSEITLDNLESLSIDSAKELAKHDDCISLGLVEISNELLSTLSKVKLSLNNIKSLSNDQYKTISTYKKGISINGIQKIDAKAAGELLKVGTRLELLGVESIVDEVANILAAFKGELHLGCKSLSEKCAKYLGEVKRKQGKNELHLPNIDTPKDIEGKGIDFLIKEGITLLRDFPKLDFDTERVVGICYALKGGLDYAWEIDSETWECVKEDNEEFATYREISKMGQIYCDDWVSYFPDSLKSSVEFYLALAESCKEIPIEFIKLADKKIKANSDLMLKFLKPYQSIHALLEVVDKNLKNDKAFVIDAIKASPRNFQYASDKLRDNQDVVNCLLDIKDSAYQIQYASDRFKSDSEIAKVVLSKSGSCLEYFNDKIKKDKELAKIAVDQDSSALQFASKELLNDKEFLLSLKTISLEHIPKKLLSDKNFAVSAIEKSYQNYLISFDTLSSEDDALLVEAFKKLKLGKDICKQLLMICDSMAAELPKELSDDLEIAKILIAKDISNFENVPAALRKNKELKTFFENIENSNFEKMSDEDLRNVIRYSTTVIDYENAKSFAKAVKNIDDAKLLLKIENTAYPHLPLECKQDETVAEMALSNPENVRFFPKELLNNSDFIKKLLDKEPRIFEYLPETFKKDKQVVVNILNQNVRYFEDIDKSFQSDSKLIELVISNGKDSDLSCLEKLPNTIKNNLDFAIRLAKKGYVLESFQNDKEIVLEALKINSNTYIDGKWKNNLDVALLAPYSGVEPITKESALYNRSNLIAKKFLEAIALIDADNLDNDAIEFIRASGYDCFIDNQIPRQDYEENDYDEDEESENSDDDNNDED